ncbi:hypothetical protein BP422_13065 [Brevibacillus formosus]|uniref:YqbQ/XkdQ domain-containing protein n=1 Tax=Brevibacillus formosus TaxID=54913 RepID=A0A220MH41_9BACL|nr:hypothetical protein [Brevibacillus formosus]ASJ54404.1 hypothetical protein BP422_13065 [Brevibacillus formosus]
MYELYLVKKDRQLVITEIVGNISWKSSIDALAVQLDFEVAFNDARFFPANPIELGDMVVLVNNGKVVFQGFVVDENRNGRGGRDYTCFDAAFYLNESKTTVQFVKTPAAAAIERIVKEFEIPIGGIDVKGVPVTKIYNNRTPADIIRDIISHALLLTGQTYRMEVREGRFYVLNQQDLIIYPTFKLADNVRSYPIGESISNPKRKRSIQGMRNSVQVTSEDKIVYTIKESATVKKYGLLQESINVDKQDVESGRHKQIANVLLGKLNRIDDMLSFEVLGSDELRSGRLLYVEEETTGTNDLYLITAASHTIKSGIHKTKLDLEPKP